MKRCVQCETRFEGPSWLCPSCGFAPAPAEGVPMFAPELAQAIGGYDAGLFDAHGGPLSEQSFWTVGRAALITWALRKYAPRAGRFLEVGCGTGGVLRHLERTCPAMELTGAEALLPGLQAARARLSRTALLQLDARRLPFDAHFDAVGAFDVLEHIEDDQAVLRSMATALRPGGVLLVTVPQHPFLFGPADVSARHVRRYTRTMLLHRIRAAGCRVVCATSFVSVLFPVMAGVRLWARWRGGEYDSAEEYRTGALNGLGAAAMAVERGAIRVGVRWPFGGSLLVVACRDERSG